MTKTGGAPGFPVFRSQAAAHLRRHAQKLEGVRRDVRAVELLGAHAGGPQDVLVAAAGVSAEDVVLLRGTPGIPRPSSQLLPPGRPRSRS